MRRFIWQDVLCAEDGANIVIDIVQQKDHLSVATHVVNYQQTLLLALR